MIEQPCVIDHEEMSESITIKSIIDNESMKSQIDNEVNEEYKLIKT
jgi:hypothetical protein